MSELIPRTTIEAMEGHRTAALEFYEDALTLMGRAEIALRSAEREVQAATSGASLQESPYGHNQAPEVQSFRDALKLPDAAQYRRVAARLVDIQLWSAAIAQTDLEHLMDKEAKDTLRDQMTYVPEQVDPQSGAVINQEEIDRGLPPFSAETVYATLAGMYGDRGTIFRRGLANAFAQLDRRFRSHDGFKIGSRVILSHAFDDWGSWNYHRSHRDTLTDIERVFLVLDNKEPRAQYAGIVGTVDAERKEMKRQHSSMTGFQSEHEGDYFRVRIFKNGNAHLWFTRKDLVVEVNKLLAQHYGEAIGDGVDAHDPKGDPFEKRAVGFAKNFGFYETPPPVLARVMDAVPWAGGQDTEDGLRPRALEPSAGTGVIAKALFDAGYQVDCVEAHPDRTRELNALHFPRNVVLADFLSLEPKQLAEYDLIAMNPPFDRDRDIDHVHHAFKFLKPGGTLVAIMSAGTEFHETRKAQAFRDEMKAHGARWQDLPAGSFREAGTEVNTLLLTVKKNVPVQEAVQSLAR